MEERKYLQRLVERYVRNQADEKELEAFFYLLEQGKLDDILKEQLDNDQQLPVANDMGATAEHSRNTFKIGLKFRSIAAAVAFGFLLVGTLLYKSGTFQKQQEVPKYELLSTQNNEIKSIQLSDSSIVTLNSNSTLKYTAKFNDRKRMVELIEGEAYFDIKHDAARPFVVKAGNILTNVLGTAFNIRSFKYINTVKITVTHGKVGVQNNYAGAAQKQQMTLLPDEQADINRHTGSITKNIVKSADILNWRAGGLYFDNESFRDVAAILETKFGISLKFANKAIPDYRFTAGFKSTENLTDILNALCLANNLSYKIHNKTVTLKKR